MTTDGVTLRIFRGGVACIFLTNQQMTKALNNLQPTFANNLEDFEIFVSNTVDVSMAVECSLMWPQFLGTKGGLLKRDYCMQNA